MARRSLIDVQLQGAPSGLAVTPRPAQKSESPESPPRAPTGRAVTPRPPQKSDSPDGPTAEAKASSAKSNAASEEALAVARAQRDEARLQRDEARLQRNEARALRSEMKRRLDSLTDRYKEQQRTGTGAFSEVDFFREESERSVSTQVVKAKLEANEPLSVREREIVSDRLVPMLDRSPKTRKTPGKDIAFLTVGNDKFVPGLEAMLRSFVEVYPDLESDVYVFNDGTLNEFCQQRLRRIYPNLHFRVPDMDWFDSVPQVSDNHKRIGKLGYMNIYGLTLEGYSRVILLDSDIIIYDDISALWEGDDFIVCLDAGDREYAVKSEYTGQFVFNSGVVSIPGHALGSESFEAIKKLVHETASVELCHIIDRFADQKVWNIFLKDKAPKYAPANYNCNIKYVIKSLNGQVDGLSIVHFAGPKPWNDKTFIHEDFITPVTSKAVQYHKLWIDKYRSLTFKGRLREYHDWAGENLRRTPVKPDSLFEGRKLCVMIGNGPSIEVTDLEMIKDYERFAFNWFLLHDRFDEIKPDHLVLASHMFFGGWYTQNPQFPPGYLERLLTAKHRPVLWTSFYFRELFESLNLHKEFEVNYVLFEKPFKRFIDKVGRFVPDIDGFLDDGRTGVISAAIPAALGMGFETVVLVGCDSNYNQAGTTSKYFYDQSEHTSLETNEASLTSTWTDDGRGQFVYRMVSEALKARGVDFIDCTVNGAIRYVEKRDLEFFRRTA